MKTFILFPVSIVAVGIALFVPSLLHPVKEVEAVSYQPNSTSKEVKAPTMPTVAVEEAPQQVVAPKTNNQPVAVAKTPVAPVNEVAQPVEMTDLEVRAWLHTALNENIHLSTKCYLVYTNGAKPYFLKDKQAYVARCIDLDARHYNAPPSMLATHFGNPNY